MAHESPRPSLAASGADMVTARSYLFAPGDQVRKLQHARGSGADAIIADLEDAVAPSAKANARRLVARWLSRLDGDQSQLWVRVNGSPPLLTEDIHAVVGPAVTGICLPKTQGPDQLGSLGELLGAAERQAGLTQGALKVVALVESAAGLLSARAIAEQPRVWQLGLGELDLCAEIGLQPSADERELLSIRVQVVLVSAAAGLASPIGPVSTDFQDLDGLRHSTDAFAVLGSAADGRSIPPRCRSSTRSSRPHQTRWRRRGVLWSAMTVPSTKGSVSAWTRMAGWSMRRSCARRVESWRGLATRRPRSLVSSEDERPSRRRRKNFLYNHFKAGLRAAASGGRPRPADHRPTEPNVSAARRSK